MQAGGPLGWLRSPLGKGLTKALRKVRTRQVPEGPAGAIDKLLGQVKGVGLPDNIRKTLAGASKDANVFGEYADRASVLTTEDVDGNPIPGVVNGKSQIQWLTDQLEALFKWRNALIQAAEIAAAKRAAVEQANHLANIAKRTLGERLTRLRRHPSRTARRSPHSPGSGMR